MTNGMVRKQTMKMAFMNLLLTYLHDYEIDYERIAEAFYEAGWRLMRGKEKDIVNLPG